MKVMDYTHNVSKISPDIMLHQWYRIWVQHGKLQLTIHATGICGHAARLCMFTHGSDSSAYQLKHTYPCSGPIDREQAQ